MSTEGQLVVFELNNQQYGLPILDIQEIIRMVDVKPVPSPNESLEGIINLRGKVIPVLNLRRRLGFPEKEHDGNTRIIVVDHYGKKAGMVVDKVLEVGSFTEEEMELPDSITHAEECISGIIRKENRIWLLLNAEVLEQQK